MWGIARTVRLLGAVCVAPFMLGTLFEPEPAGQRFLCTAFCLPSFIPNDHRE